jgi:hypothetical protein
VWCPLDCRLDCPGVVCDVSAGKSYRYAVWLPAAAAEAKRPQAVRNFRARHASGDADTDWTDTNNINPQWYRVSHKIKACSAAVACMCMCRPYLPLPLLPDAQCPA